MPKKLEVFDCWRSSSASTLSTSIIFDICGKKTDAEGASTTAAAASAASGMPQFHTINNSELNWAKKDAGGVEQQELLDANSISIDSSIQAWSEDGHRDHITEGRKRRNAELSRKSSVKERRRSSPIVNGSLILSAGRNAASNNSESSLLKRRHPTKSMTMSIATLPPRNLNILSTLAQLNNNCSTTPRASSIMHPCRMSSASFTSPLSQFPSIPAREKGVLMNKAIMSHHHPLSETVTGTPTTAKPSLQFPTYHGLRNGPLVVKNASPLIRQVSQTRVDDSPLDTPSMTTKRWTIEQDSPVGRTASTMIDNLLQGVQQGAVTDTLVVDSPIQTDFSGRDEGEEEDQTEEWETEDCAMTPQLVRGRWQDLSPVASKQEDSTEERVNEDAQIVAVKKVITKRQSSFLEIPSCIFPHTPAGVEASTSLRRQTSIGIRRRSNCSIASIASSTSKSKRGSRSYRNSTLLSATVTTTATGKRRSVHAVSTPRIVCRKSKYYSRQPRESGVVPPIVQQHIQGARGKFWSPLNKKRQSSSDFRSTLSTHTAAADPVSSSARFSRRSGQAWLQPKTIENRSEFKVTVYPPQVEQPMTVNKSDIVITVEDTDRTPTQALFKRVTLFPDARVRSLSSRRSNSSSNTSSSTTSDYGKPRIPPPAVSLPALPLLGEARSSFARDVRRSLRSSRALNLLSCSCTGTSSVSGTCSCTTGSRASTYSDYTSCSCTDQSVCSCTEELSSSSSVVRSSDDDDSSFSIRVAERTTPLSAPIREVSMGGFGGNYPEPPHSAPFYSSLRPPVLDPLPRLSPFRVDFFFFDNEDIGSNNGVKDRLSKRYSIFSSASTCLTCSTVCTTSSQCSECRRLQQRSSQRICSQAISSALTNDKKSRAVILDVTVSPSFDSSPENGMESDIYISSSSSSSSSSTQDSELPLTPPRSEYQDNIHVESPGYRVSLIVSPIPPSVKEEKAMAGELYSSYNSSVDSDLSYLADESPSLSSGSSSSDSDLETASVQQSRISYYTSTTTTASSYSNVTSHGPPRSILKTSRRYQISEQGERGPNVTLSLATSSSAFSSSSSAAAAAAVVQQKKRTTTGVSFQPAVKPSSERYAQQVRESHKVSALETSRHDESSTRPSTPEDLDRRIKREDHRRVRNESRLYALDKLEGKEKRSSLFSAVASTTNQSSRHFPPSGGVVGNSNKNIRNEVVSMTGWQEVDEDDEDDEDDTFSSATPLTPVQRDLIELEKQAQRRQQEHIKTAPTSSSSSPSSPSVFDYAPSAPSFDMFVCPKLFLTKKSKYKNKNKNKNKSNKSSVSFKTPLERQQDERLKTQLKKLGTAVEVRQIARDRCIDR